MGKSACNKTRQILRGIESKGKRVHRREFRSRAPHSVTRVITQVTVLEVMDRPPVTTGWTGRTKERPNKVIYGRSFGVRMTQTRRVARSCLSLRRPCIQHDDIEKSQV
jgi:hypothetical protein